MKESLTARQLEIFEYLKQSQRKHGVMPSTREIQRHFNFASQTAAVNHLRSLEKKGVIQRLPGKARALILPDELDREEMHDIPIYGEIAAGYAQEGAEHLDGYISINKSSIGLPIQAKTFALRVNGLSMIEAHICPGDTVILEKRAPQNNNIVAALIDGEMTLKRFVTENKNTFLRAENDAFPDLIPIRELSIQGVMVALIRKI